MGPHEINPDALQSER